MMLRIGSRDNALRSDSRLPFHSCSRLTIRRIVLWITRVITTRFGRSMKRIVVDLGQRMSRTRL